PRLQPHQAGNRQDARQGRGEAGEDRPRSLPAPCASLADSPRTIHLQGAAARVLALPGGPLVPLPEQGARTARWQRQAAVVSVIDAKGRIERRIAMSRSFPVLPIVAMALPLAACQQPVDSAPQ